MNYYEHHLGDYIRDTAHLAMVEEGAYRRLLDAYYTREKPLPADLKECCKLARAQSKVDRDAVAYVLKEFFRLTDLGYQHKRCDEEIDRAYVKINAARENGKKGGRPRNPEQTQSKPTGLLLGSNQLTQPITQQKALQSPVSNLQEDSRREDEAPPVGTIKTQIYRLAKQLEISAGIVTNELKAHTETEVWRALGSTLSTKPAEPLAYFRGCLKVNGTERFKSA